MSDTEPTPNNPYDRSPSLSTTPIGMSDGEFYISAKGSEKRDIIHRWADFVALLENSYHQTEDHRHILRFERLPEPGQTFNFLQQLSPNSIPEGCHSLTTEIIWPEHQTSSSSIDVVYLFQGAYQPDTHSSNASICAISYKNHQGIVQPHLYSAQQALSLYFNHQPNEPIDLTYQTPGMHQTVNFQPFPLTPEASLSLINYLKKDIESASPIRECLNALNTAINHIPEEKLRFKSRNRFGYATDNTRLLQTTFESYGIFSPNHQITYIDIFIDDFDPESRVTILNLHIKKHDQPENDHEQLIFQLLLNEASSRGPIHPIIHQDRTNQSNWSQEEITDIEHRIYSRKKVTAWLPLIRATTNTISQETQST